jgi:hypothetical protein
VTKTFPSPSTWRFERGSSESFDLRRSTLNSAHSEQRPLISELKGDNGFGEVYVLRFPMKTDRGAATVLTAWVIRHGEDFPRLTTCYIV